MLADDYKSLKTTSAIISVSKADVINIALSYSIALSHAKSKWYSAERGEAHGYVKIHILDGETNAVLKTVSATELHLWWNETTYPKSTSNSNWQNSISLNDIESEKIKIQMEIISHATPSGESHDVYSTASVSAQVKNLSVQ